MKIEINIETCLDCRHKDHTGAFTPGGAIPICHHKNAPNNIKISYDNYFSLTKTREQIFKIFKPKTLNIDFSIPDWCPLKLGYKY